MLKINPLPIVTGSCSPEHEEGSALTRFVPLKSNATFEPVLYIDTQAPVANLYAGAEKRLRMARELLECLEGVDECDIRPIASCALMLIIEGCNIMAAADRPF